MVESETKAAEDYLFYLKFAPDRWRYLPMTVLHVGKTYINWEGRVAPAYDLSRGAADVSSLSKKPEMASRKDAKAQSDSDGTHPLCASASLREVFQQAASGSAGLACVNKGSAAVIGYYPGMELPAAIAGCERVWLADHFLVHHPSGDPLTEADRATLRKLWDRQAEGMKNLHRLGIHSASNLARIPDASLDFLYLPGEAKPDWLAAAVPHWLPKLKDGAVVCGDLYGLPHWPDATCAIALLLGTPLEVAPNGFWWGRKRSGLVRLPGASEAGEHEVILVNEGTADIERLLVTMHQVRQSWSGRMRLYHWGPENQGLRIAAARHGVEMIGVEPTWPETSGVVAETLDAGIWREAVYLPPGALVLGKAEDLFSRGVEAAEFDPGKPWRMQGATKGRPMDCHAGDFEETAAASSTVLLCTGPVETWTDAAWARWSGALTAMTAELAAEIRGAADATVVILVGAREIDEFEQVWLTLKFSPAVPVIVGLIGVPVEDVWLAPTGREPQIVALSAEDSTRRQIAALLASVRTERVFLLPPNVRPLPGAELFPEAAMDADAILDARTIWPGEADEPAGKSPVFGIFHTESLRRICADAGKVSTLRDHCERVDMTRKGWQFQEPPARAASPPHPLNPAAFPV